MTEFRFITNGLSSTTYDGPSGFRYVIYSDKPFDVGNDQDIAFFRENKRFEEVSIIEKILPPEPKKDIDELFKEELDKIKLTKKTREIILKSYMSKKDFVEDLEDGYKLGPKISKSEKNRIKFHFLKPKVRKTKKR